MKLSELNLNPVAKVRESTNFTVREVKKVCKNIGPRPAGSDKENEAQDYYIGVCEKFCDETKKETFSFSKETLLKTPIICSVLVLLGIVLFVVSAFLPESMSAFIVGAATGLDIVGLLVFLFVNVLRVGSSTGKGSESSNVILVKKPKGEVKRRIILSGHMDSSCVMRKNKKGALKTRKFAVLVCICVVICLALNIASVFADMPDAVILGFQIAEGIGAIIVICGIPFADSKTYVDGANKDLTGVFASVSVMQFLTTNEISLDNTEVMAVSMGASECGNAGAKAFANAHNFTDVETIFISLDCIRNLENMMAISKDKDGTVKYDASVISLLKDAAKLSAIDLSEGKNVVCTEDAAFVSKTGVKSAALTAVDPAQTYFRTAEDKADNLDVHAVEKAVEILINTVLLFDEKGI